MDMWVQKDMLCIYDGYFNFWYWYFFMKNIFSFPFCRVAYTHTFSHYKFIKVDYIATFIYHPKHHVSHDLICEIIRNDIIANLMQFKFIRFYPKLIPIEKVFKKCSIYQGVTLRLSLHSNYLIYELNYIVFSECSSEFIITLVIYF